MKKIALYLIMFIPVLVIGQNDPLSKKEFKHEIGTNIVYGLAFIINGEVAPENNYGLIYKRSISEFITFRILPSVGVFKEIGTSLVRYQNYTYLVSEIPNVSKTEATKYQDLLPRYQLKSGFEYNVRSKYPISFLTGIDLYYSYRKATRHTTHTNYTFNDTIMEYERNFWNIEEQEVSNIHNIGLSPFVGFEYKLSKRWNLSAYFNLNFTYHIGNTIYYKNTNPIGFDVVEVSNANHKYLESWGNGIISDLSISYRF